LLDPRVRWALYRDIDRIRAREQLELINALSTALDGEANKEYRLKLGDIAFEGDDVARVVFQEAVTRRRE
jgi:hypothetical protein